MIASALKGISRSTTPLPLRSIVAAPVEQQLHYRNRLQLAIQRTGAGAGVVAMGLYESGTHRVVDMHACCVQHPATDKVVSIVQAFLRKQSATLSVYDEASRRGALR